MTRNSETIAVQKGTPTQPGVNSPFRNRTIKENQDLFSKMKLGEFKEGRCFKGKNDMSSSNMLMRDPIMYRILLRSTIEQVRLVHLSNV